MSASNPYRGRFAPSPTGPLHFGSLLAALASFLDARHRGGEWLLRIEDIDEPRTVPGATDAILRSLERHYLHWDGPVVQQSERIPLYRSALARLRAAGLVYPCSCSRRELARSAPLGVAGRIYPGFCRQGPCRPEQPMALRLRVPGQRVGFHDRCQGVFRQELAEDIGDFVIRRADGLFAYQLVVVVDDAAQGITDVVRGSDLLDSTPRQLYLQSVLGLPAPRYLHIPIMVDGCGDKLSKQTGAPPLDDARPVPALLAALRLLGQRPPEDLRRADAATVIDWARAHWAPERIPVRSAVPWSSVDRAALV